MTIHDKHAFEDAQIMARAALNSTDPWWRETYWNAAMGLLKFLYTGE